MIIIRQILFWIKIKLSRRRNSNSKWRKNVRLNRLIKRKMRPNTSTLRTRLELKTEFHYQIKQRLLHAVNSEQFLAIFFPRWWVICVAYVVVLYLFRSSCRLQAISFYVCMRVNTWTYWICMRWKVNE